MGLAENVSAFATRVANEFKALRSRNITAGTGLTGGGDLTADRTLTVAFGSTSTTVAAGNHTHTPASIGAAASAHTHTASEVTGLGPLIHVGTTAPTNTSMVWIDTTGL